MGVEPTRDRAERPLSRFEDGETHRGPYTSICRLFCHAQLHLSSDFAYRFNIDLGEVFDHQVGRSQSRQIPFACNSNSLHTCCTCCLDTCYCIFNDQAVVRRKTEELPCFEKQIRAVPTQLFMCFLCSSSKSDILMQK
jgi:hypothetical protein